MKARSKAGFNALPSFVKDEIRWMRKHDKDSARTRASQAAEAYEGALQAEYADDPPFFEWDSLRALNRQDFDYLFWHRDEFSDTIREWLEIVAAKITHEKRNGDAGYFNKLEKNVGWVDYIAPLLFTAHDVIDPITRCGIWANAKNSRRCHKPDLCAYCLWLDYLEVLILAFGSASGAFYKAPLWLFMTLSYTTNPKNSKAAFKTLAQEDYVYIKDGFSPDGLYGAFYQPHPVQLGDENGGDEWFGVTDARVLMLIGQEAVKSVYPELLDGYKIKSECAFSIIPHRGIFCLPHLHGVANTGKASDGRHIARQLYTAMETGLSKYRESLSRELFPDVKLFAIPTPEDLERVFKYTEKVVPIDLIVRFAMRRPGAKTMDGKWNSPYLVNLERKLLVSLIDLITDTLFRGFPLSDGQHYLPRRKTVGNMIFSDKKDACIGNEPEKHAIKRRKNAKEAKKRRNEKNKN